MVEKWNSKYKANQEINGKKLRLEDWWWNFEKKLSKEEKENTSAPEAASDFGGTVFMGMSSKGDSAAEAKRNEIITTLQSKIDSLEVA